LGKLDPAYFEASVRQKNTLLKSTPRCENGAISHRVSVAESWSDFTYMALPFLAYLAYKTKDEELVRITTQQCSLQQQILAIQESGLWRHVIGPENRDEGLWSSGNGWAICGMVRVFAILQKYNNPGRLATQFSDFEVALVRSISDIISAAVASDGGRVGLLRNYLNDPASFRENAGTAAIVSAIFRMATLKPSAVATAEMTWAEFAMHTVLSNIAEDGVVSPVANPMDSKDPTPYRESAEGQAFVMHMIAAYVDWTRSQSTHSQNSPNLDGGLENGNAVAQCMKSGLHSI
jgi:rhamnogalacturonyl hydrolase YesR